MPSVASVRQIQGNLVDLTALTVRDLLALLRTAEGRDAQFIRDLLVEAYPEVVGQYANAAGVLTADWYESLPGDPAFRAAAATVAPAQLEGTARWAAGAIFSGGSLQEIVAGSAKRHVFNASRETVLDNAGRERVTWARYASANACPFCRMLATRGSVYTSESAATRVGGRGKDVSTNFTADGRRRRGGQAKGIRARGNQSLGSKYHDNCRCMAVPVRSGDTYEPPGYVQDWAAEYTQARAAADGVDAKSILAAWRKL